MFFDSQTNSFVTEGLIAFPDFIYTTQSRNVEPEQINSPGNPSNFFQIGGNVNQYSNGLNTGGS